MLCNAPMIDLTGNNPFLPGKTQNRVKQEMANEDSGSDDDNNTIPPFRHYSEGVTLVTEKATTWTRNTLGLFLSQQHCIEEHG